jgi:hypothetical protein
LLAKAALPPDRARTLAAVLEALAAVLRRPERVTDWPAAIAHAERLAASHAPGSARLAETLRLLHTMAQRPEEERLRAADELEAAARFLRAE